MTAPRDMPPGPAHLWDVSFLGALADLEDAVGQFCQVALPDLLDRRDPNMDLHLLYDRLVGTVEELRTVMIVLWSEAVAR